MDVIVLYVVFLSEEPKVPPLLAVPRADKPLPIIITSSSSPTLTDGSSHDNASARDPIDLPPPSANFHPKVLLARLTKRTHALLDHIESERDYVSDLALIRDIYLPVALGMCHMFVAHTFHSNQLSAPQAVSLQSQHPLNHRPRPPEHSPAPRAHPPQLPSAPHDARRRPNHFRKYFRPCRAR
jgi:hypothetical protein